MARGKRLKGLKDVNEATGIDFSFSGVKVVRVKKTGGTYQLLGASLLPAVELDAGLREHLNLPKALVANYAGVAYTGKDAVIRVLSVPLADDQDALAIDSLLRSQLNVNETFRTGSFVIHKARAKQNSSVLGVAVPAKEVALLLQAFADGAPALRSVEVASLSTFSAFHELYGDDYKEQCICLLDSGRTRTTAVFMERGTVLLYAKFDVGADTLNRQIETDLGVDNEMVRTILAGGSVDISSSVDVVQAPVLRQLSVSRDFVARKAKMPVSHVFMSGGMSQSEHWMKPIESSLGIPCSVWDPLEPMKMADGVWPDVLQGQQHRFCAAIGAAIGALGT